MDTLTLTPDAIATLLAGDLLAAPWSLADAVAAARTGGLSAIVDDGRIVALDDAERPDRSARVWSRQLGHEVTAYRVAIVAVDPDRYPAITRWIEAKSAHDDADRQELAAEQAITNLRAARIDAANALADADARCRAAEHPDSDATAEEGIAARAVRAEAQRRYDEADADFLSEITVQRIFREDSERESSRAQA